MSQTREGNGILNPRVVSVKGNNIFHAHRHQFLESQSAVQRFTAGTLVLAALVEEGHDYGNAPGLASHSRDEAFQILKVVIGRHVVFVAAERVGEGVIAHVHQNIQIVSPDRFIDNAFCLPGTEAGSLGRIM